MNDSLKSAYDSFVIRVRNHFNIRSCVPFIMFRLSLFGDLKPILYVDAPAVSTGASYGRVLSPIVQFLYLLEVHGVS